MRRSIPRTAARRPSASATPTARTRPPRSHAPAEPAFRLRLIGGFELSRSGVPVALPPGAQRVVAYVALHETPATRVNVAATLWLSTSDEHAMANLRSALWRIKRSAASIMRVVGDALSIVDGVQVDLRDQRTLARAIIGAARPAEVGMRPESLLVDDLLPDWYDDWVLIERERFRQLKLHALERLSERLIAVGAYGRAIEAALAALACDALRESPYSLLIRAHLAEGNRSEAVREFRTYTRVMHDELGLEPSAEIRRLMGGLVAGRPGA